MRASCRLTVALVISIPGLIHAAEPPVKAPSQALSASEIAQRDAVEAFLRGRLYASEGEISEALENLRKAVEKTPNDGHLRREYADLLLGFQILPEAEREARKALELIPDSPLANRTLGQVLLASAKDNKGYTEAVKYLKKAAEGRPSDPSIAVPLAQTLLRLERPQEAASALENVLDRGRGPAILTLYAEALEKSERYQEAEEVWAQLIRQEPNGMNATLGLLRVLERSRQYDRAIPFIEGLAQKQPRNLALQNQLGLTLLRARRLDDARKVFEQILKVDPENRDALRQVAIVYSESLETDKAEETLRSLQKLDPDDPDVPFRRALNFMEVRRFSEAEAILKDLRQQLVTRKADKQAIAQVDGQLAYAALLRKDYSAARSRALPHLYGPEGVNSGSLNLLLQVAREEHDDAEGLRLAREATAKGAKGFGIQGSLGEFLVRSKDAADQREGTKILGEMAKSKERGSVLAAADAWQRLERYKEAVDAANQGLSSFPGDPDLLFRLGASLERDKRHEEAVKTFLELIAARPDHAAALNYLGYMWAERGENLDKAQEFIGKAVELEPSNGAYLDSLGWVYYQVGKLDLAEKYLLEAVRLAPDDPTVEEHLGDLYAKKGDLARAQKHWKRALELKPEDGGKKLNEKLAASTPAQPERK